MKKLIYLLLAAVCLVGCDEGDIQPVTPNYNKDGRTLKVTGQITGLDTWTTKYTLRVASFSEESDYALLSKSITAGDDGQVNVTLTNISDDATKVELCVLDRLRQRVFTLQEIDITSSGDTIRMDIGNLNASMFNVLQSKLFDERCISCHRNGENPSGQLTLTEGKSYGSLVNKASYKFADRTLVLPGNATNSVLYQLMNENLSDWRMPHADIIKEDNVKGFIKEWIDNGAKE